MTKRFNSFDDRWQMEYAELSPELFKDHRHTVSLTYDATGSSYEDAKKFTDLLNRAFSYAQEHGYLTISVSHFEDTTRIGFIVKEESDFESFARYVAESQL